MVGNSGCSTVITTLPITDDEIARLVGVTTKSLWAAARRVARAGYHCYTLRGKRRRRVIAEPRRWLKGIQDSLYQKVLRRFPVSAYALSAPGHDAVEHASQHMGRPYLVVLDIRSCFPSTTSRMVRRALLAQGMTETAAALVTRLVTHRGFLPQGAPTSPGVLNLVWVGIDQEMTALAERFGARYSRYVDDLCFSGDCALGSLAREAAKILDRHGYRVSGRKRQVCGPKDRHLVTGIMVGRDLAPTPEYLNALLHQIETVEPGVTATRINQIRGRIGWVQRLKPSLARELSRRLDRQMAEGNRRDVPAS